MASIEVSNVRLSAYLFYIICEWMPLSIITGINKDMGYKKFTGGEKYAILCSPFIGIAEICKIYIYYHSKYKEQFSHFLFERCRFLVLISSSIELDQPNEEIFSLFYMNMETSEKLDQM